MSRLVRMRERRGYIEIDTPKSKTKRIDSAEKSFVINYCQKRYFFE